MKIKLIYPNIPFWRAEVSRLALFIGGIEFEDFRPSSKEIKKMKNDGILPFGQFPILQVNGKTIAQTGAIARFCGKLSGLYPSENQFNAAKVDEVIDLATDITNQMKPALREIDPKLSKKMRRELAEIILPRWLGFLEKILEDNNTNFFVGNSLSIADLAAWRLCGWIAGGIVDGIPVNILENYARLNAHQNKIDNLPKIVEWKNKSNLS
tara:strand:+ start:125 stop:754 length:630 start_codon:yes stop_codon:yes gene_type:complete